MRTHAKAVGNRLEVLLLFMNAVLRAPPPGLMNERAVRGIHQSDDSVIDIYWHLGLQVSNVEFAAELFNLRSGIRSFLRFGETCASEARVRDIYPYKVVLLFAGIASGVDSIYLQGLIRRERRDQLALTVVHIELPTVIDAFEVLSIEVAAIERHSAMRT